MNKYTKHKQRRVIEDNEVSEGMTARLVAKR